MQPPYAPNVQNQTVDYGGIRWKGNPGQGWTQVGMTGQKGSDNAPTDPMDLVRQAQEYQKQQNQPAIATLQGQETSLAQQYKDLLDSVTKQGNVGIDTATRNQNAFLASRGIYSQGGIGGDQISQAQSQAGAQAATQEAQVQTQGAQDINALAAQIASLQAGNVPNALGFSSNIAGLQEALAQQQLANQRPFAVAPGQGVYNPATGQFTQNPGPTVVNPSSASGADTGGGVITPQPGAGDNSNTFTPKPGLTYTTTPIKKSTNSTLNLAPVLAAGGYNNQSNQNNNSWLGSDVVNAISNFFNPNRNLQTGKGFPNTSINNTGYLNL